MFLFAFVGAAIKFEAANTLNKNFFIVDVSEEKLDFFRQIKGLLVDIIRVEEITNNSTSDKNEFLFSRSQRSVEFGKMLKEISDKSSQDELNKFYETLNTGYKKNVDKEENINKMRELIEAKYSEILEKE